MTRALFFIGDMMKIIELRTENVKRIKLAEIKPDSNMVVISGKNAQGKTSLLDSILMAFGGAKTIPNEPIRKGEETASIVVNTDQYLIERNWTKSGNSYLKVTSAEGAKIANAQSFLDGLIGNLSFDPMEFCNKSSKDRVRILKDVAGIDLSDLEKTYKQIFEDRTFTKRELKNIEGELLSYAGVDDIELESIENINQKREDALRHNEEIRALRDKVGSIGISKRQIQDQLNQLELKMKDLVADKELAEDALRTANEAFDKNTGKLEKENTIDTADLDKAILEHGEKLVQKKKFEQKTAVQDKLVTKKKDVEVMTNKLAKIEDDKKKRLEDSDMPIDGLDFVNGDVSYEGIEFDQISSAQKIKISMSIAMAMNPKIKVIRIMNGSLLDDDTMKEIEKIAVDKDYQIWVECVSSKKEDNCIYIEDGEIV